MTIQRHDGISTRLTKRRLSRRSILKASGTAVATSALGLAAIPASAMRQTPAAPSASDDFSGLVDIGGRRLYVEIGGEGGPTVVLEGGFRTRADFWIDDLIPAEAPRTMVFAGVAEFTRVVAYERPGAVSPGPDGVLLSRSDPAPMPRTAAESVDDLHALLQSANIPAPYVLVGHSYGGMFIRLYAATWPDEVVGMVLVDAFSEGMKDQMTTEGWAAYEEIFQPVPAGLEGYADLEFTDLDASVEQAREATTATPLADLPLVVLSRGQAMAMGPDLPGGLTSDGLEAAWTETQAGLAALLPDVRRIIAEESEHYIQLQQPELVIEAIRDVVDAVRAT